LPGDNEPQESERGKEHMKKKDFLSFFDRELFIPELKGRTKNDVLEEMVNLLSDKKKVKNGPTTLSTILQREKLGSTGLGGGVAIPHSRSLMVDQITVVFARSEKGIRYKARDNALVHLFFMILAPPQDPGNLYLPLLGKIVEVIEEKKNREKLMKMKDYDEFIDFMDKVYKV
jgi:mannitol/fructose-specific phosphotransferase system IIA component (Ntr-type)